MEENPNQDAAGSVLALIGLPGAGKSTLAKKLVAEDPENRVEINYDELREELYGKAWVFNHKEEDAMKKVAMERAEEALKAHKAVIVSNTNLTEGSRDRWEKLAERFGVPYDFYELTATIDECIERDKQRTTGRVGRAVIERFALFTGWINWDDDRYGDREFVIVDVDGTLADTSKRKNYIRGNSTDDGSLKYKCSNCQNKFTFSSPPDPMVPCESCGSKIVKDGKKDYGRFFAEVHLDEPKQTIINLVKDFNALEYNILVVSGRPIEPCGIPTEDWLEKHQVPLQHLFMRQGYDRRPDDIIKQEILDLLPPKDRIAYVLDDRNRVVDMWRKNGLTCLQVAPGDF